MKKNNRNIPAKFVGEAPQYRDRVIEATTDAANSTEADDHATLVTGEIHDESNDVIGHGVPVNQLEHDIKALCAVTEQSTDFVSAAGITECQTPNEIEVDVAQIADDLLATSNVVLNAGVAKPFTKEEAEAEVQKIVGSIEERGKSTDVIIAEMCNFELRQGLIVSGCDGQWGQFHKKYLPDSSLSKTTLYHLGEVAEHLIQYDLTPSPANNKAARAACKVKKQDRVTVWDAAVEKSGESVPTPEAITAVIKASKDKAVCPVDLIVNRLTEGKSMFDIDQARNKVNQRIENIKGDQFDVEELRSPVLIKVKAGLDAYFVELTNVRHIH